MPGCRYVLLTAMLATATATAWPITGFANADDAPRLLATPAWGRPGVLSLRVQGIGSSLLLRRDATAVYRYDPQTRALSAADTAAWDGAAGAVALCSAQIPARTIRIDTHSGRATLAGRELAIAGAQAVTTLRSPSERLAVLLSAGAPRSSLMPALGAGHQAPFHHQVLALADGRPIGAARRLPFSGSTAGLTACWSADERFVVYADLIMTVIAIVKVEPEGRMP